MQRNWRVRSYRNGDERNIVDLLNLVFGSSKTLSYWRWKYRDNPLGFKACVADDGGRVVGHFGLVYSKIKVESVVFTGSQAVDSVTHPDYRHQGMFVTLDKHTLNEAGKEGVPLTYGFPNEAALPGHLKVGWVEVCSIPVIVKPLNAKALFRDYIRNDFLLKVASYLAQAFLKIFARDRKIRMKDLAIHRVRSFDDEVNRFWSRIAYQYLIIQPRDKRFLNWRFLKNPDKSYTILAAKRKGRLAGYIVLGDFISNHRRAGAIVDMLTSLDDNAASEQLIMDAIEHFKRKNVDYIACLMRKGNIHYTNLIRHGFFPTPKKTRFIIRVNSNSCPNFRGVTFSEWFFTWGDSDFM